LTNATSVNPTFTIDKPGAYTAQLIVNDGMVNSAPDTVVISTVNSAPVANAGPDQSAVVGQSVHLDGSGSSDVDGNSLTYQWSFTSVPPSSTVALSDPAAVQPTFVVDKPGTYVVQLLVNDGSVSSAPDTVTISTINSKPVANAGADQEAHVGATVQLDGSGSTDADGDTLTYQWSLASAPAGSSATLTNATTVQATFVPDVAATYVAQLIVNDGTVNSEPDTATVIVTVVDTTPPPPADLDHITVGPLTNGHVTITGTAGSVEGGAQVTLTNTRTGQTVTVTANADGSFTAQIDAQAGDTLTILVTDAAGNVSPPNTLTVDIIPPDPATVAPPLDLTVATDLFTATAFLYTGPTPIQTGVAPGVIDSQRVTVIRGKVLSSSGAALPGVKIAVLNHPEFGQTLSRADGMFDLAANGGGMLTVTYTKAGYLPAQRQVDAPWRDYVFDSDVTLIQRHSVATEVAFGDTAPAQLARGSMVTDNDGVRRATVLFPEGVHAELEYPDGTREPRTTLQVRATEYTVGVNGPLAMLAELPPSSAYTYAVELDADEAVAAGATSIQFDRLVSVYVENFLSFSVGAPVPIGFYDRMQGVWLASANGRVVKIIDIVSGRAEVDTDGDGLADDGTSLGPLGLPEPERQQLASLYVAGQTLWRLTTTHFTPGDANWGGGEGGGGGGGGGFQG
jgi:hypothetical protein